MPAKIIMSSRDNYTALISTERKRTDSEKQLLHTVIIFGVLGFFFHTIPKEVSLKKDPWKPRPQILNI